MADACGREGLQHIGRSKGYAIVEACGNVQARPERHVDLGFGDDRNGCKEANVQVRNKSSVHLSLEVDAERLRLRSRWHGGRGKVAGVTPNNLAPQGMQSYLSCRSDMPIIGEPRVCVEAELRFNIHTSPRVTVRDV